MACYCAWRKAAYTDISRASDRRCRSRDSMIIRCRENVRSVHTGRHVSARPGIAERLPGRRSRARRLFAFVRCPGQTGIIPPHGGANQIRADSRPRGFAYSSDNAIGWLQIPGQHKVPSAEAFFGPPVPEGGRTDARGLFNPYRGLGRWGAQDPQAAPGTAHIGPRSGVSGGPFASSAGLSSGSNGDTLSRRDGAWNMSPFLSGVGPAPSPVIRTGFSNSVFSVANLLLFHAGPRSPLQGLFGQDRFPGAAPGVGSGRCCGARMASPHRGFLKFQAAIQAPVMF